LVTGLGVILQHTVFILSVASLDAFARPATGVVGLMDGVLMRHVMALRVNVKSFFIEVTLLAARIVRVKTLA
jgi:hypothetical protein